VAGRDSGGAVGTSRRPPLSLPLYKRVFQEITDDDVPGLAAQVAFYMFSSLPPALLVIFSLTGFVGGDGLGSFISRQLESSLPGSVDDPDTAAGLIGQFIAEVVTEKAPGPLSIGLLLGLWASSAVFVALTDALNRAYELKDDRSWFRRRAIALAVMFGFALLFLGGSAVMLGGAAISEAFGLGPAGDLAWTILQGPLALLLIVVAFFLVYYVLPDRDQSTNKLTLFKASVVAAILWLLASFGFRMYIANFGSYGETYGFVGAILVLLLWMYVTAAAILIGGEISAEMERRPA
jgi:membrane protein